MYLVLYIINTYIIRHKKYKLIRYNSGKICIFYLLHRTYDILCKFLQQPVSLFKTIFPVIFRKILNIRIHHHRILAGTAHNNMLHILLKTCKRNKACQIIIIIIPSTATVIFIDPKTLSPVYRKKLYNLRQLMHLVQRPESVLITGDKCNCAGISALIISCNMKNCPGVILHN